MAKVKICDLKISISKMNESDITNELTSSAKNQILKEYMDTGMKIEIKEITNPEAFAKHYFENRGYLVVKSNELRDYVNSSLDSYRLIEKLNELGIDKEDRLGAGCPDFIVWKAENDEVIDLFFAEAKNGVHGLNFNQIKWIAEHPNILIKVIWTEKS